MEKFPGFAITEETSSNAATPESTAAWRALLTIYMQTVYSMYMQGIRNGVKELIPK